MWLFFWKSRKTRWSIFDCVTGSFTRVERLPFEIGSGDGADLKLNGRGVADRHCALNRVRGGRVCLVREDADHPLAVNGALAESAELTPDTEYAVQLGTHFLVIQGGQDPEPWQRTLNHNAWSLYDSTARMLDGPMPLPELLRAAVRNQRPPDSIILPQGLTTGFYLQQVAAALGRQAGLPDSVLPPMPVEPVAAEEPNAYREEIFRVAPDKGVLTCPVCWLRFDPGDIMHVAVHDSLRGDPLLGQDAQLRFAATQFNDRGQALDALGLPCTEIACPHCRRVLPAGFVDVRHLIFSIVGDQAAGKSYYLTVLTKLLPIALYRHFGITFQDADPAGNAMLNDMKKTLFSAQTPEQARLVKTQLEGAMYERLPRYGRTVALPKPFVFSMAAERSPGLRCSVIFYDNAGEHFQPGRDSAESPGAQHVASSSGLMFLFDPFNSPEFRRRIDGWPDPQFEKPIVDQQDVILAETRTRIQKLLGLPTGAKVKTPLAILIGKCDAWMYLLGDAPFINPLEPSALNLNAVWRNSEKVRKLMLEICPTVVANAESISETTMYFPISSFGNPPVKVGSGDYVPDPRKLEPLLTEIPPLWILSRIMSDLVPTIGEGQPTSDPALAHTSWAQVARQAQI